MLRFRHNTCSGTCLIANPSCHCQYNAVEITLVKAKREVTRSNVAFRLLDVNRPVITAGDRIVNDDQSSCACE